MSELSEVLAYCHPAGCWDEALPLGNGRLGAMVFSDPSDERIFLNEDTLCSGHPSDADGPEEYRETMLRAAEAVRSGDYLLADRIVTEDAARMSKVSVRRRVYTLSMQSSS